VSDVADRAESALLYIRAGLTHLAVEIRVDALAVLEWMLGIAGEDFVTCPGGWVKTLKSFMSMMGWATSSSSSKWTSATKASFGKAGKAFPKQLLVLAQFLKAGLVESEAVPVISGNSGLFPLIDVERHMIPTRSNAYAHLNLFGSSRDEEGEMYIDREDRQRVFHARFGAVVQVGLTNAIKEGGEVGRAAAVLTKVLKEGMADYSGADDTP
jgi:pre-rRNA-processing protein IPI1